MDLIMNFKSNISTYKLEVLKNISWFKFSQNNQITTQNNRPLPRNRARNIIRDIPINLAHVSEAEKICSNGPNKIIPKFYNKDLSLR